MSAASYRLVPYDCEPGCCAPAGWVGHECLICKSGVSYGGTVEVMTESALTHAREVHWRTAPEAMTAPTPTPDVVAELAEAAFNALEDAFCYGNHPRGSCHRRQQEAADRLATALAPIVARREAAARAETSRPPGSGNTEGNQDGKHTGVHPGGPQDAADGPVGRGLRGEGGVPDHARPDQARGPAFGPAGLTTGGAGGVGQPDDFARAERQRDNAQAEWLQPEPPDSVLRVTDYTAGSCIDDNPTWGRTTSGEWKGYKDGGKEYLPWAELCRHWGPLTWDEPDLRADRVEAEAGEGRWEQRAAVERDDWIGDWAGEPPC